MLYTYKMKLKPTKEQSILLNKHCGSVVFVYNKLLEKNKTSYEETKKSMSAFDMVKQLTKLKAEYPWLKEINSQSLQQSIINLGEAYSNFFKKKAQFPKFHSKFRQASFCTPQNIEIKDRKIYVAKFRDGIKIENKREIEGQIRQATFSRSASGDYFVAVLVEKEVDQYEKTGKNVGLDLGIKDLIITSDGSKYDNPKNSARYEKNLARYQRMMARKTKGSNRRNKAKIKVARVNEKITNCRKDTIHKATTDIVKNYDIICIEDLNTKGMLKNHKLAKSVSDASFGEIKRQLEYKCAWHNKKLVTIDRWFPSSKNCSQCGYKKDDLTLKIRSWVCPECGAIHDRDINAANNILVEGLRLLIEKSAGTVDNTQGARIRPKAKSPKALALNCEALSFRLE